MLLGNTSVKLSDIEKHCSSYQAFISYADKNVPEEFKHVPAIVSNQRYYHCMLLRQSNVIEWIRKSEIIEAVMQHTRIVGFMNTVNDIRDIYNYVDIKKLKEYLEADNGKNIGRGIDKRVQQAVPSCRNDN